MTNKTVLNVKTDKDVKVQAQHVAQQLGLPLSTVVNAFLKQFIKDKEITFSTQAYRMTPYLEKVLALVEKDRLTGKNVDGPFIGSRQVRQYLDSLK